MNINKEMTSVKETREQRNKLYRETPYEYWCGTKGCDTAWANVDCANNSYLGGYENGLKKCPNNKYKSDFVQSKDRCVAYNIDRMRKCSRLPVDNDVFNPLETEYKALIANRKTITENLFNDIHACCSGEADLDKCGNLYMGYVNDEQVCKSFLKTNCMQNLDTLNTPICRKWCIENENLCNRNKVQELCQNENVKPDNTTYWPICGCYYKEEFYQKLREQMSKAYNVPIALLSGSRSCYFPGCNGNKMNPAPDDEIEKCDRINLLQCVQSVNITGDKVTLNEGSVVQSEDCDTSISSFKKQNSNACNNDEDCPENVNCISGICTPLNPKSCTDNKDCDTDFICESKICVPNSDTGGSESKTNGVKKGGACTEYKKCDDGLKCISNKCELNKPVEEPSNLPLIIGLSVGGLVLLLIIIGVLFKMKSSSSSSTGTSS